MDTSVRTRLALIICNTEFDYLPRRDGADVDVREMKSLLQDLGYTVKEKENLTAQVRFLKIWKKAHVFDTIDDTRKHVTVAENKLMLVCNDEILC